jgi:hypothetical protein
MKTTRISMILLALLLAGVLSTQVTYARKPASAKTQDMVQLQKIIKKSVKYPDFKLTEKEENGEIFVTFILNDIGKIEIDKIAGPSARVENYVKEKLQDITASDVIHPYNQMYKVKIRFDNN